MIKAVERAAAHERERRHFNGVAFQQLFDFFDVDHFVQRVIKRTQIRIDFFLQRARQESQTLAGFDGRTRQNDAAHTFRKQRRDGLRHSKIRFTGACRADAEDEIVPVDRFHVQALRHGLRRDYFFAEAALLAAVD